MEYLSSLDAVERVEPLRITYSKEFKKEFMLRYHPRFMRDAGSPEGKESAWQTRTTRGASPTASSAR